MCPIFLRLARLLFATIEDRLSRASTGYEPSANRADDDDPSHSPPCGLLAVLRCYVLAQTFAVLPSRH
jgi:hypothetical protein